MCVFTDKGVSVVDRAICRSLDVYQVLSCVDLDKSHTKALGQGKTLLLFFYKPHINTQGQSTPGQFKGM